MEQFRSKHKQTQSEWEAEMSKKVLEFVRSELYMDLRFLDIALGTLVYRADENIRSFATDGTYLYFSRSLFPPIQRWKKIQCSTLCRYARSRYFGLP